LRIAATKEKHEIPSKNSNYLNNSSDQVRVPYQRNEESNRRQSSSRRRTGFVAAAGATNYEDDSTGDRRRRMGEEGEWG
jgi:hypothetical protein